MQPCRRAAHDRRRTAGGRHGGLRPASAETAYGTVPREPRRSRNSVADTRSTWIRPATGRHLARSYEYAGDGTHAHNTLSADSTNVQVFYPFHPLHGVTLRILRRPERGDGAVCVMDPAGRRLKIPIWMLLPECAEITISQRPHLSKQALLSLGSLITSQLDSKDPVHDNLRQTRVSPCERVRAANTISSTDDANALRPPAQTRSATHGPDRWTVR